MAGQRVIASNRIPRVRIANRGIAVPPAVQAGGAVSVVQDQIGSIGWFAPGAQPPNYQDVTTPLAAPLTAPPYDALLAVQGVISGKTIRQSATPASTTGTPAWMGAITFWNGQLVSIANASGNKFVTLAAYNSAGWTTGANAAVLTGNISFCRPVGARLFTVSTLATPIINIVFWTNPSTPLTAVNLTPPGGGGILTAPWDVIEAVSSNTIIFLTAMAGPIYRSTDNGLTFSQINGPNLNNPADRVWCAIWRNLTTGNLQMVGQAMAIATSTDNGATWTVNAAVANANNINAYGAAVGSSRTRSNVEFNLTTRRGYAVCQDGSLRSFAMDNPTAGFTIEQAATSWSNSSTNLLMASSAFGLWVLNLNVSGARQGLWFAPWANVAVTAGWSQVSAAPPLGATPSVDNVGGMALDMGDGFATFLNDNFAGAAAPLGYQYADGISTFDRYVWTPDPGLPSGRKPYVRVI